MKILLLFLIINVLYGHTEDSSSSTVIELDYGSFEQYIQSQEFTMIEFYAPQCKFCQKFAPVYEEAAIDLKNEGISLAKYNCYTDINEPLCEEHNVLRIPSIKIFQMSKYLFDYKGRATSSAITRYMRTQDNGTWIEIETTREFIQLYHLIKKVKFLIVGSFDKLEGEGYSNIVDLWRRNVTNYKIRVTDDLVSILNGWQRFPNSFQIEIPDENSIVLFHEYGGVVYTGSMDLPNLLAFIKENEEQEKILRKKKAEKTEKAEEEEEEEEEEGEEEEGEEDKEEDEKEEEEKVKKKNQKKKKQKRQEKKKAKKGKYSRDHEDL